MPKHIFFIGRQIPRSAPAFLFFVILSGVEESKKNKKSSAQLGAQLRILLDFQYNIFTKETFSTFHYHIIT